MKIKPINGNILIDPVQESEKTKSGIYIAEEARKQTNRAIVVATDSKAVKEGQEVMYQMWAGDEIIIDNYLFKLIKEDDLLAVIS